MIKLFLWRHFVIYNVPMDAAIDILLKRIYERKKINTSFTKQEFKELILLCTKGVHFTLYGKRYIQTDGVTMGSPFMVELENTLVATLSNHLMSWKRWRHQLISKRRFNWTCNVSSQWFSSVHSIYIWDGLKTDTISRCTHCSERAKYWDMCLQET